MAQQVVAAPTNPVSPDEDPYHLSSSENPAWVLVNPQLNDSNYHSWSRAMIIALKSKNKMIFIDGTATRPPVTDPKFGAWERCNTMVQSWLLHAIEPSIARSIMYNEKAVDLWNNLRDRFGKGDAIRIADLQDSITSLRQGAMTVNSYYTQLQSYWDELDQFEPIPMCDCNDGTDGGADHSCKVERTVRKYQETGKVIKFLRGLNENYEVVRSQIMIMDPFPQLIRALYLVQQHERQVMRAESPVLSSQMQEFDSGLVAAQGFKKNWNVKRPQCTYCHKLGHTVDKCYKKHGYPPNNQNKGTAFSGHGGNNAGMAYSTTSNASQGQDMGKFGFTPEQYSGLLHFFQQNSLGSTSGKTEMQSAGNPTGYLSHANHLTTMAGPSHGEDDW